MRSLADLAHALISVSLKDRMHRCLKVALGVGVKMGMMGGGIGRKWRLNCTHSTQPRKKENKNKE